MNKCKDCIFIAKDGFCGYCGLKVDKNKIKCDFFDKSKKSKDFKIKKER